MVGIFFGVVPGLNPRGRVLLGWAFGFVSGRVLFSFSSMCEN